VLGLSVETISPSLAMTTLAWINLSLPSNYALVAELEEFQKNMFKQNKTNTIEISNPLL
jgi:hypothetical protein